MARYVSRNGLAIGGLRRVEYCPTFFALGSVHYLWLDEWGGGGWDLKFSFKDMGVLKFKKLKFGGPSKLFYPKIGGFEIVLAAKGKTMTLHEKQNELQAT